MPSRRLTPDRAPYTRDLADLARRVHAVSPPSPHRPFVVSLVREVRGVTKQFHAENWYRGLIVEAGLPRRPSSRTITAVLTAAKDAAGEAIGPTTASIKELRRQMTGMTRTMGDLKDLVAKVVTSTQRQEQIGDALAKRQLVFADQAQTYQRQIDQLTATVQIALRQVGVEVDRMSRAASDVTLDTHRVSAAVQQAARSIAEAVERLGAEPRG